MHTPPCLHWITDTDHTASWELAQYCAGAWMGPSLREMGARVCTARPFAIIGYTPNKELKKTANMDVLSSGSYER